MSASVADTNDVHAAFLTRFGFHEFDVAATLEGGMFSRPRLVEADGGRYVLRTHAFRGTVESFRFQAETIAVAVGRGAPCAQVVPLPDGSWCEPVSGDAVMALHEYVPGEPVDWLTWHDRKRSAEFLADVGRQTALLHNALYRADPRGDAEFSAELPPIQFDRLTDIRRQWDRDLDQLQRSRSGARAVQQLVELRPRIDAHWAVLASAIEACAARLPRQIVHGDISPVNLIAGPRGWTFIDWDCVHVGWRLYDALGDVLNRPPVERPELNEFRPDHVAAYLSGYADAIDDPLSANEQASVLPFCLARQLEDLRQRVRALPHLADRHDADYATLIALRVDMMDQITRRLASSDGLF